MNDDLSVYLDGTLVGALAQTRQGSLGFAYDPAYLALSDPAPLSLSLPLRDGPHPNRVVRAFLEGLLPDNQAVRERWGATYGVSANNPFALLRQVGRDAAGAVQDQARSYTRFGGRTAVNQRPLWLTGPSADGLAHAGTRRERPSSRIYRTGRPASTAAENDALTIAMAWA